MTNKNKPYVKKIGHGKVILNPITKATPYKNIYPTTAQQKAQFKELKPPFISHYKHCVFAFVKHKKDEKIKNVKKVLAWPIQRNKYGIPVYELKKSLFK